MKLSIITVNSSQPYGQIIYQRKISQNLMEELIPPGIRKDLEDAVSKKDICHNEFFANYILFCIELLSIF
jgi:hypothetical protein